VTAASLPRPRSDGSIRWGVLATGGAARIFTKDLIAHGHSVRAVGSRSLSAANAFAESFGIARAYGTYEELVGDPDVDVVYVATPHNHHANNAALALQSGKHVLVEKPFTLTAAEAADVTALARRNDLLVMEAMWTRFLPHMAYVRSVIREDRIGEVLSLHAHHVQRLPTDDSHRINSLHLAGGALLDLGVYPISFAFDILGTPVDIAARAKFKASGVDGSVATIFQHRNGAIATTYSSSESPGRNTAAVLGTDGYIEISATWYAPAKVSVYDADNHLVDEFDSPVSGRGMQYEAVEVERLLGAGKTASTLMPPQESVRIMATLDDIRRKIGLHYPDDDNRVRL
jgi:predicted dehydrogenase